MKNRIRQPANAVVEFTDTIVLDGIEVLVDVKAEMEPPRAGTWDSPPCGACFEELTVVRAEDGAEDGAEGRTEVEVEWDDISENDRTRIEECALELAYQMWLEEEIDRQSAADDFAYECYRDDLMFQKGGLR